MQSGPFTFIMALLCRTAHESGCSWCRAADELTLLLPCLLLLGRSTLYQALLLLLICCKGLLWDDADALPVSVDARALEYLET